MLISSIIGAPNTPWLSGETAAFSFQPFLLGFKACNLHTFSDIHLAKKRVLLPNFILGLVA